MERMNQFYSMSSKNHAGDDEKEEEHAVNDIGFELETFWGFFLASGLAKRFGEGDCAIIAGRSGVEIAYMVLESSGIQNHYIKSNYSLNRSREYWTGWALAWYQWKKGISFENITAKVSISDIRDLYNPYHEMDIRQFEDWMDDLIDFAGQKRVNLQKYSE
ncbi:MAG: hypothetical protein LUI13_10670 [Lachnospiraceae bacterium]|nr:hypothetical protein [Lachnospiraceae bacterium]